MANGAIYAANANDLNRWHRVIDSLEDLGSVMPEFSSDALRALVIDACCRYLKNGVGTDMRIKVAGIADGDYAAAQTAAEYTDTATTFNDDAFNCT